MMKFKAYHVALAALPLTLTACEFAPKTTEQNGIAGTGMNQVNVTDANIPADVPPPPYDLPPPGGPRASEVYENVQVLGDISADEFNYLMAAITEWVAPEQGCNYCHNPANMASDEVYTKGVARSMIQMTQDVNQNWSSHVSDTGVTCWTCHRGNNIPENVWTLPEERTSNAINGNRRGQNEPMESTGYSSLPNIAVARYLLDGDDPAEIGVASETMHPTDANTVSTMDTEATFSLMIHMSNSLGVNCTYCHNTQAFAEWNRSTPARATAWHGIRMVRNINSEYITPLTSAFPDNRLGPAGDPYKTNCTTCHQGQNLPMGGVQMVADYPALRTLLAAPSRVGTAEEDDADAGSEMTDTN